MTFASITKILVLCALIGVSSPSSANERADLYRQITELDYLIDTAKSMQTLYRNNSRSQRFNYVAYIEQLTVTRNRITEYLNAELGDLKLTPPAPVSGSLVN